MLTTDEYVSHIREAAAYIRGRLQGKTAEIAVVLGSGLSTFAQHLQDATVECLQVIDYADIPHCPMAHVSGHTPKFFWGRIGEQRVERKRVYLFGGRVHSYEGKSFADVCFFARLAAALGSKVYVATNASGGSTEGMTPGCFMIINDHLRCSQRDPLAECAGDDRLGRRYINASDCWSPRLRKKLKEVADSLSIRIFEGVYTWMQGPSYETHSEISVGSRLGANCFGMSSAPECIAARALGMEVAGVSVITNLAAGLSGSELNHDEVKDIATVVAPVFQKFMASFIQQIEPLHEAAIVSPEIGEAPAVPIDMQAKFAPSTITAADVAPAARHIEALIGRPDAIIVACYGSGTLSLESSTQFPIQDLPNFPRISSTFAEGIVRGGRLKDSTVLIFDAQCMEGFIRAEACFLALLCYILGVRSVTVQLAGASLKDHLSDPTILRVDDVLHFSTARPVSFVEGVSSNASYNSTPFQLFDHTEEAGRGAVVYAYYQGPSLCTNAEANMLTTLGASVVGVTSTEILYTLKGLGVLVDAYTNVFASFAEDGLKILPTLSSESLDNAAVATSAMWLEKFVERFEHRGSNGDVHPNGSQSSVASFASASVDVVLPFVLDDVFPEVDSVSKSLSKYLEAVEYVVLFDNGLWLPWSEMMQIDKELLIDEFGIRTSNVPSDGRVLIGRTKTSSQPVLVFTRPRTHRFVNWNFFVVGHLKAVHCFVHVGRGQATLSPPSNLSVIRDQLNITGYNALCGPNVDSWGPRFCDMSDPHSRKLRGVLETTAKELGMSIPEHLAIYCFDADAVTPAEARYAAGLGVQLVCSDMLQEALLARHMKLLSVAMVSASADGDEQLKRLLPVYVDAVGRTNTKEDD